MEKPIRAPQLLDARPDTGYMPDSVGASYRGALGGPAQCFAFGQRPPPYFQQPGDRPDAGHASLSRRYPAANGENQTNTLARPIVIAVDDEPGILMLLQEALEREGMEVHCASSVAECLALKEEFRPDVYVVDLSLPDGSGFDLVRNLRKDFEGGIVILSGRGEETDNVLGLELGADDYVVKPFRQREFTARVNAVIRRARQPAMPKDGHEAKGKEAKLRFGEYTLSTTSRLVWDEDGHEVPLTTAEFDLLRALVASRGRVVDRDNLMNAMKGREWEAYDRAIDGLVSRLRKKLPASPGCAHFIRTVHGVGYCFTA